ncbi:MAG: glycoside hydrolase family 19 protein [Rubrivivax sp.]|nr:MAG: glycoside hydrolase family 19 protein [Rubrivivax sp.]
MKITIHHLGAAGVTALRAAQFVEPLNAACALHGIDQPDVAAAFLAQLCHETGALANLTEDLFYTNPISVINLFRTGFDTNRNGRPDQAEIEVARGYLRKPERLANRAYANRNGNGSEASGDGWRYRGRGGFQLTGRANYAEAAAALDRDYLASPDLVAQPSDAMLTSAWFWSRHGLTDKLLQVGFDSTTRAINGAGMVGADDRKKKWQAILQAMKADKP